MVVKEVLPKPWDTIAGWACLLYPMGTSVSYVKLTHDSLFGIKGKAGFVPHLYHAFWLPECFSQHKATTWLLLVSLFAVALAWLWSSRATPKFCDLYIVLCAGIASIFVVCLVLSNAEDHQSWWWRGKVDTASARLGLGL